MRLYYRIYEQLLTDCQTERRVFAPPAPDDGGDILVDDCFYPSIGEAVEDIHSVVGGDGIEVRFTVTMVSAERMAELERDARRMPNTPG